MAIGAGLMIGAVFIVIVDPNITDWLLDAAATDRLLAAATAGRILYAATSLDVAICSGVSAVVDIAASELFFNDSSSNLFK